MLVGLCCGLWWASSVSLGLIVQPCVQLRAGCWITPGLLRRHKGMRHTAWPRVRLTIYVYSHGYLWRLYTSDNSSTAWRKVINLHNQQIKHQPLAMVSVKCNRSSGGVTPTTVVSATVRLSVAWGYGESRIYMTTASSAFFSVRSPAAA